ncbi:uncharacterized protein LOC26526920 [Drosophila erecta]|uniref:SHSP domain-containing protein n=1 Tax=Drosophila erecta TaxID=7220 RepID=A0A0Q5W8M4_DROER|nr:uncharacterized protein LOC26526920 [Drosophila erecta]KQS70007.1 uncharacterized protein Dere_GG27096 [Drosophila erecta]
MSGQKNNWRLSSSQVFERLQSEYEPRVNQLENDVYECCRILNNVKKAEDSATIWKNHREMEKYVSWELDMRDFPMENICIQLKDKHVFVRAYYKNLDINREILMPQNVDISRITAILTHRGILTISAPIVVLISDDQKLWL